MTEIDIVFQRDLSVIRKTVLENVDQGKVCAILLYGGYGRGEGSWVVSQVDEVSLPKPYNDYDIALVLNDKISTGSLKLIEERLKQRVDVRWIDICQYTKNELRKFKPSIKNFDFKNGSMCIYGEGSILNEIPDFKSSQITLVDIETLYLTRIWTLIGSFPAGGLVKMDGAQEMFFRNQMAKCVLAIVDCVLVQNDAYHSSYRKRVRLLEQYTKDKELLELAGWALDEKLFPKSVSMGGKEICDLYHVVNKKFFDYFFACLSRLYQKRILKPEDAEFYLKYRPESFLKRIVKKYLFGDRRREIGLRLAIIQGLIAYYYFDMPSSIERRIRRLATDALELPELTIDEIRLEVAEMRTKI